MASLCGERLNKRETQFRRSAQEGSRELRLIEFLAVLAALLGVVYAIFPVTPSMLGSFPLRDFFAAYLLFFMIYSAVTYALFQIISDSSLLVFTGSVLIFFAVVLAVFFALYYILVRIVGSMPPQSSNA